MGKNRRTLEYGAGGAGLGALLGAGAGLLTFTRGGRIKVPAETTMRFRLDRTLVLKPKS